MSAGWENLIGRLIQIYCWIILNRLQWAASSLTDDYYNSGLSPLFEQYLIVTGVNVSKILHCT